MLFSDSPQTQSSFTSTNLILGAGGADLSKGLNCVLQPNIIPSIPIAMDLTIADMFCMSQPFLMGTTSLTSP